MPALRRSELAWNEKFRRCLYFFLRDELDALLIEEALIESYRAFREQNQEYPFVEMRELKPRAKIIGPEHPEQKHFMVMFNEEPLPSRTKKQIRFFDSNRIIKENLAGLGEFDITDVFHQRMRFFEDKDFPELLQELTEADFAVLIQRDPTVKARYRYGISHFHVRIDWPVADAAQDLARKLRYISKDLYEKGDREAELLQQKLYEYYGMHHTVGGRRTAACVAAQFMQSFDFISTIYISSSEARTLYRISEKGTAKYVLIRVPDEDIRYLSRSLDMDEEDFSSSYLIDRTAEHGVGIFHVTYSHNEHSLPPKDSKLREFSPDYPWVRVDLQLLTPPPHNPDVRPVSYSKIYS